MTIQKRIQVAVLLSALAIGGAVHAADIPPWWTTRGIINTQQVNNDYAPANVGQLKNVAYQTWVEVTNQLAQVGINPNENDPQVGTNTANYLPKWDGNALVSGSVYDNGNVGIGTANPLGQLHVQKAVGFSGVTFTGTGLNDLAVDVSGYTGTGETRYIVKVSNTDYNPNWFLFSRNHGEIWSQMPMISADYDIGFGVIMGFGALSGHTAGDQWEWTVSPTFFESCEKPPAPLADIENATVLGFFGDFITTDHISPAGNISKQSPAADYLRAHGVAERDFNSYGSRRGNHEVMMRGTFANIRIQNKLVQGEGGRTLHLPTGEELSIYEAAMRYAQTGTPLVILAGKMYGAGSSRDWAAKGPKLLGVRAVLAESFERIHRSNLVGMGILPCELINGETAESLGLTGRESFSIRGLVEHFAPGKILTVRAGSQTFQVKARVDAPLEIEYLKNGGVLHYVLRNLMA